MNIAFNNFQQFLQIIVYQYNLNFKYQLQNNSYLKHITLIVHKSLKNVTNNNMYT